MVDKIARYRNENKASQKARLSHINKEYQRVRSKERKIYIEIFNIRWTGYYFAIYYTKPPWSKR